MSKEGGKRLRCLLRDERQDLGSLWFHPLISRLGLTLKMRAIHRKRKGVEERDSPSSLPLIPDGEEEEAGPSYIHFKKNNLSS